jgi:glutathione synthase/RimK-type ligase-like ATP-grasp enzyme
VTSEGRRVDTPFAVVGVPGHRRVTLFRDAAARSGLVEPYVISWRDVLVGGRPWIPPGSLVRIDSPGEDPETDALLRGPGDPSRAGGGAAWFEAIGKGLRRIAEAVRAEPGARLLGDVDEIAVMCDKRLCHARLAAAGVPVPPAIPGPVGSYRELRERMATLGWARVFVKPAHGSSASGVIAFQALGRRVKAVTSAALSRGPAGEVALHNSLRVRTYEDEADVAAVVDALAPDGLHVERWFPKASTGGRVFDLRVVVVAGTVTHVVVRAGRTPMTNLHLGGARGDLGAVRERLGDRGWRRALEVAEQAAAAFPGSLTAGVDLMIGTDMRSAAVAEVNAFGDLLPGLMGLPGGPADGLDTYAAQIAAVSRGWRGGMQSRGTAGRGEGATRCAR